MPKLSLKIGLVRCGRCGRRYSNPATHVCAGRRKGRTRVKPAVSVSAECPRCGRRYSNPLGHTCASKPGDFKRRRAAAEKRRRAEESARRKAAAAERRRNRPQHRYETCRDDGCERVGCVAYRTGYHEGFADGMEAADRASR